MTDIVAFLTARLDEREARAKLAISVMGTKAFKRPWGPWDSWEIIAQQLSACCDTVPQIDLIGQFLQIDADPARVLADVAAKRRVMARHRTFADAGPTYRACEGCGYDYGDINPRHDIDECPELRDLAAPHAAHPDFNQSWRVDT